MVRAAQASPDSGFGDFRVWLRGCGGLVFRVWRCAGVQREVRPNGGTGCSLVYNFVSCLHVGSQKRI